MTFGKASFRSLTRGQNVILSEIKVSGNISDREGAQEEAAKGCAHNIALCLQNDTKNRDEFFLCFRLF